MLEYFAGWEFGGEQAGFASELVQFVQKSSTSAILKSMRAPETELAKLEALPKEMDGKEADAISTETRSEEGSRGTRETGDDLEYDSDDLE